MDRDQELEKIERLESQILREEKKILHEDQVIVKTLKTPSSLQLLQTINILRSLKRQQSAFVRRISKRRILFGLLVTVGMVGVWRGTWEFLDMIPWLHSPFASIAFGVLVLYVLKKVNDLTSH
jgi:hypothetical protein